MKLSFFAGVRCICNISNNDVPCHFSKYYSQILPEQFSSLWYVLNFCMKMFLKCSVKAAFVSHACIYHVASMDLLYPPIPSNVHSCVVPCGRGTFRSELLICEKCDYGKYQDQEAQDHCKACPEGLTTEGRGAKGIDECTGGYSVFSMSQWNMTSQEVQLTLQTSSNVPSYGWVKHHKILT